MSQYEAEAMLCRAGQQRRDNTEFFRVREIVDHIRYKDWSLTTTDMHMKVPGVVVYWNWFGRCVLSGQNAWHSARGWPVPTGATEEEIVRIAFAAAKMAEEHECAEHFNYKGRRVFDPHKAVL